MEHVLQNEYYKTTKCLTCSNCGKTIKVGEIYQNIYISDGFFIDNDGIIRFSNLPKGYKLYTLEEFEKEFPFKIGDKVTIIGIPDFPKTITKMEWDHDEILYSFEGLVNTWFGAKALKKFEMKEERNITLTLEKAKEWYNKGGELKEVALQAYSEKELNPLPRSWEEYTDKMALIRVPANRLSLSSLPEKYIALYKLEQLRNCWRNGREPDWLNGDTKKYAIKGWRDKSSIEITYVTHAFLSFPTYELALEFQKCFRDLIEKAGDLI